MAASAPEHQLRSGLASLQVSPEVLSRLWTDMGRHLERTQSDIEIDGGTYDAVSCYSKAIEVNPRNVGAWRGVCDLLQQAADDRHGSSDRNCEEGDDDDADADDHSSSNDDNDDEEPLVTIGGTVFNLQRARIAALECDPKAIDLWLALGNQLSDGAVAKLNGRDVTALDCFAAALSEDVAQPEAWFYCGEELAKQPPGATCTIVGKSFAAWQCTVEGLKRDPKGYAPAWIDLAKSLPKDMKTVLVGNARGHMSRADCIVTALEIDDDSAEGWQLLGLLLSESRLGGGSKTAKIQGVDVAAHDCFIRSIELDPGVADAWVGLGNELRLSGDGAVCAVANTECSAVTCFAAALRLNKASAAAWRGLGGALDANNTSVTLDVNGDGTDEEVTPLSCMVRAVELDGDEGTAWLDLARAMPTGGAATIGEWQRSQIDCFAEACRLAPNEVDCWIELAEAIPTGGVVKVGDRIYGQLRCYTEALRCDPQCALAWTNVGVLLAPGAVATVFDGDEGLTQVDCYCRALRLRPDNSKAVWRLLATALRLQPAATQPADSEASAAAADTDGGPRVDVFKDGRLYSAADCDRESQ